MIHYMKKLKTISQSNLLLFLLIFITLIYSIYFINIKKHQSIFDKSQTNFNLTIKDYKYNNNKITIYLDGKEKLISNINTNTEEELNYYKQNIKYGSKVTITGTLNEPTNNTTPNTFNYKKYLYYKNIYYTLKVNNIAIDNNHITKLNKLKNKIKERINKIDNKGYINAFILGNKDNINKEVYKAYQNIGVTHLFALSGMHIGLISTIYLKIVKRTNIYLKYTMLNIILLIYGYIVNFPASIKRCLLFFLLSSINKVFKLNISTLKIFAYTVITNILINPFIIYDTGFQFSICTVFGIIYCSKEITGNKITKSIKLSIITFLFSLPITLSSFYSINILSIIYNLVYIPIVSTIIYPLSLISFFIPQTVKVFDIIINILELTTVFLSKVTLLKLNLSLNIYEVIIYYIFLILSFKINKKFLLTNILIIILDILIPYLDSSAYIYYLDVDQGDASLIITPYKKEIILIDTGGKQSFNNTGNEYKVSDNYLTLLKSLNINKIDYLIITHGDYDHMGDSTHILNNTKVKNVIFNCGEINDLENELIDNLSKKKINNKSCIDNIKINNNEITFLNTKIYNNENDNSNVILLNIYNYKLLFMGDAGIDKEKDILKQYNLPNIDVLKVGHHGSRTSSSKEFINEIKPKHSVISVGKNNRYGHPNREVLNNLKNTKIYRTDEDGSIMFKIKNNKLKIETCSP